jgi:hypothetical protein
MANTITWAIDGMSESQQIINGFSEVVLNAIWRCTNSDDATPPNTKSIVGICIFPNPQENSSFIPYDQLTQSEILNWCYQNGVNKTEIEAEVSV